LEVTTADHILFGTDWPAAPEVNGVRNIDNLISFDGFTPDELRKVVRDNALRLFPQFNQTTTHGAALNVTQARGL
jgi:predicted TIM-barrel fold metal-dependent hydrolase